MNTDTQKQLDDITQKRVAIESELAELRAKQRGDMGGDVRKAVERHEKLTAEIAGRESVLRTLKAQLEPLQAQLATEREAEKKAEIPRLKQELEARIADIAKQAEAVSQLARDPELKKLIDRLGQLDGQYAAMPYANQIHDALIGLNFAEKWRNAERFAESMLRANQRHSEEAARAARNRELAAISG